MDILIELKSKDDLIGVANQLVNHGYKMMSPTHKRISLNKGYTHQGYDERVFHIHLRVKGDNDELYFRYYLIEFPEVAKKYEMLKIELAKEFKHNRDEYTNQKHEFINAINLKSKELYQGRYK